MKESCLLCFLKVGPLLYLPRLLGGRLETTRIKNHSRKYEMLGANPQRGTDSAKLIDYVQFCSVLKVLE